MNPIKPVCQFQTVALFENPLVKPLLTFHGRLLKIFSQDVIDDKLSEIIKKIVLIVLALFAYINLTFLALVGTLFASCFKEPVRKINGHFEPLPDEIIVKITSHLSLQSMANFRCAFVLGKAIGEDALYWKNYAREIGYDIPDETPDHVIYKLTQNFIRETLRSIKNLSLKPFFVLRFLQSPITIEKLKLLIRFKKARDTLIIWLELYTSSGQTLINKGVRIPNVCFELRGTRPVTLTTLEDFEKSALQFPEWFQENKNQFVNETLYLNSNHLSYLPPEISELSNIKTLYLDNNYFSEIPTPLFSLSNLTSLSLFGSRIAFIPKNIENFNNLTSLTLTTPRLTQLPGEITKLKELQNLLLFEHTLCKESLTSEFQSLQGKLF